MRKGINQWSMPETWDIRRCVEVARRAGFDGIELVLGEATEASGPAQGAEHLGSPLRYLGFHPYANDEFCLSSTPREVQRVRELVEAAGLAIPSISTVMPFLHPITSPDAEVRDRGTRILRQAIEFAGILGADSLLVVPGVVGPGMRYEDALENARGCIEALIPDAEEHDVVLAVENVWNQMLGSPLEFRDFLDAIDHPKVAAYVDVGNAVRTGFGEDWLRILGGRVDKVHVCNFRAETGNLTGFTRHLLDGDVDWAAVTTALDGIGYDGWLTAEITPPSPHFPEKTLRDIATTMDWIIAGGDPGRGEARGT